MLTSSTTTSVKGPATQKSKREIVAERSGGVCNWCESDVGLHLDHIHPRSRGGSNHPDNLQLLCAECGSWKGAVMPQQCLESLYRRNSRRSNRIAIIRERAIPFMEKWIRKHPQCLFRDTWLDKKKNERNLRLLLSCGSCRWLHCCICKVRWFGKLLHCPTCEGDLCEVTGPPR